MEKIRECLFCGNTNLSKEHIFAQWLLKELGIFSNEVGMTHSSTFGIPLSNRHHPFSRLVNGLICETCNNGWMSDLENECKSHIIALMNLDELSNEFDYLKSNHEVMAKWAFKNAILLNSATNYRQLVPDEHYKSLYQGRIPKGVFVDLAFCKEVQMLQWRQSQDSIIAKYKNVPFDKNKQCYHITFQIKHLMIKVFYYESDYDTFYEDSGAIRLYPQFGLYDGVDVFDNLDVFDIHGVLHEYPNKQE